MKIRRYMGKDTQEAILKVKMDLGSEAVILNTRKVRQKGITNLFSKPLVEVLAAVDEEYGRKKDREPIEKQNGSMTVPARQMKQEAVPEQRDGKLFELESKVSSMESLLKSIYEQVHSGERRIDPVTAGEMKPLNTGSKVLQLFHGNLLKSEIEADIARLIIDTVRGKAGDAASVNDVASVLYSVISSMLGKPDTMRLREDGKPTVVLFLGPTGVGKTTTLAKIAANYALNSKKKVGLLTADTYRIAAVDQLRTYAEILGIPISVIYSPEDLSDAVRQYSDKDIILIDTAGRSYKNKLQFDELKTLVSAAQADEVYLVMSATTSSRNCREVLSNYSFLENYKLIFTKMDEAPVSGIILNARYITGRSISYVTTGQNVPDDIEVANTDKIVKNLMGSIR